MKPKLKPLKDQVIVITGASSGIGLATAQKAAKAGAAVVLVSRNEAELERIAEDIRLDGGRAIAVAADVGEQDEIAEVVEAAKEAFGGFDTWINDAGVGLYGELSQVPLADQERLFKTNYWGVVNGSLAAAGHLREREGGGAIINIGSILSDMAAPLMGAYTASKHAVKGFTDALRMELRAEGAPIAVTLIKPASIGTPFPRHARNYMEGEAQVPQPVYAPEVVANAILHAAQFEKRSVTVGGAGRQMVMFKTLAPKLADRFYGWMMPMVQQSSEPKSPGDNLHAAGSDGETRSDQLQRPFSVYTAAHNHPRLTAGLGLLAGAAVTALVFRKAPKPARMAALGYVARGPLRRLAA